MSAASKTFLVQDTIALDAAGKLALRFGAHLEGTSSTGDALFPFLERVPPPSSTRLSVASSGRRKRNRSVGKKINTRGELSGDKTATRRIRHRDAIRRARCSDLIVFRAPQSEDDADVASDVGCRSPLILEKVTDDFANKALIAWNDSVESTRAAAAAMPMLQNAESVTVAAVLQDNDCARGISALLSRNADANGYDVLVEARRHAGTRPSAREQVLPQDILEPKSP